MISAYDDYILEPLKTRQGCRHDVPLMEPRYSFRAVILKRSLRNIPHLTRYRSTAALPRGIRPYLIIRAASIVSFRGKKIKLIFRPTDADSCCNENEGLTDGNHS